MFYVDAKRSVDERAYNFLYNLVQSGPEKILLKTIDSFVVNSNFM